MQIHRGPGAAEARPRAQGKAWVDGAGIQSADCVGQSDIKLCVRIQRPGAGDHPLGEASVNPPVATLVGAGQCREMDGSPETAVVQEVGGLCIQAGGDAPQACPPGDLSERQGPERLRATKAADTSVTVVASDDPGERRPREKAHELGEERLATIHPSSLQRSATGPTATRPV